MDSGSLQSSSGGEEEYDSRGETITTFLNPSSHLGLVSPSSSTSQGQFLSHSALFDHNFQQSLATALNSQYNNALVWPLGLRSEPNYGSLLNSAPSSSQPLLLAHHHQGLAAGNTNQGLQQPLVETTNVVGRSAHSLQSDQPKNPKKRTRASRRAPTTVLTTDTTNFRQMVQEFTGIPAGPFSGGGGGGSLYSRRLDLFSTAGSSMRTAHSDPLGAFHHHPLRPSAQKPQMPSFIPSSSNTNFQLSTEVGVTKQGHQQSSSTLFNMEADQILTFQPLLQPSSLPLSLKNPLGNHESDEPAFGSKSQGSNSHLSPIDGLGISHEQSTASLSGFLGQGSASDQARNCSTSSALELHPHDKGLENVVCSAGDGDAGSSWACPN